MDLGGGRKLTCCGDEPYNDSEKSYVENSTWLLHEAFCLHSQADIFSPYEKHHSTVKDACELAETMGAANLVLYHTEDRNLGRRKELYTEEGKTITTEIFTCRKISRYWICSSRVLDLQLSIPGSVAAGEGNCSA